MSSHFTANQFNDGFKAKHLRNWSYGINHPGSHPRTICGYTVPIADARGHLLPCIRRSPCSSPWGSYRTWIWEETSRCDCVDRIRRPEEYGLPPCNIMVARERLCPRTEANATAAAVSQQCFQAAGVADPTKPIEIYNDAFKATRLGNWSYGINHPGSRPRARCGYTIPIADSRGHLLPGIERDPCSSPWGSYRTWIWEDSSKCDCVDRLRRPEEYGNLPCNIFVARERRFPTAEAKATADACRAYAFEPQPQRSSAESCEFEIQQQAGEAQEPNEGKTQEISDRFDSYLEKN